MTTLTVGHRGARNLWPENSLAGFRKTLALGVRAIELDVHPSRDGTLMVIHDPTLERTTHGDGEVSAYTAAQLGGIRLRDGDGEGVPTLDAVLEVLAPSGAELQLEIKTDVQGTRYPGVEVALLEAVRRHRIEDRAIPTCFVPEVLERVKSLWPAGRVLASLDRRSAEMLGGLDAALARFDAIPGCLLAVEKGLLQHCLPQCLARFGSERLGAWVPNEAAEIVEWQGKGLRQITTDRPDLALGTPVTG